MHMGNGFILAETGGAEEVTLTVQQIPIHNHAFICSTAAGAQNAPSQQVLAASPSVKMFIQDTPDSNLSPANTVTPVGGSQPHTNFQPYLCVDFIISLFGIFPAPS
jgi:microcystin-dependent protein